MQIIAPHFHEQTIARSMGLNVKKFLLVTAMSVACLSSAYATDYRFFCTNQSDPAINPDHDGVFVAITYGTAQSFDVVHTISRHLYNRQVQYRVTSITQPATNSYFWEGFMLKDPNVIMTGHLWQNEGVWMYTENQRFTDGRPPKMATPPVVCHNTVDVRHRVERDEQSSVPSRWEPSGLPLDCRSIADPAQRLACYDKQTKAAVPTPPTPQAANPPVSAPPSPTPPPPQAANPPPVSAPPSPTPPPPQAANPPPVSAPPRIAEPTDVPQDQKAFMDVIDRFVRAYAAAQNDMAKGATRPQRAKAICATLRSPVIRGWIGTVYKLSSNNEGRGVLELALSDHLWVKTWNNVISDTMDHTLIDPEDPIFAKTAALKEHQKVQFSGSFLPDTKDCFHESSMAISGSMDEPEFYIPFQRNLVSSITPSVGLLKDQLRCRGEVLDLLGNLAGDSHQ